MTIWQRLKSWFTDTSKPRVLQPIAPDRVFVTHPSAIPSAAAPLAAGKSYVRIWLVELRLAKSRNWFKDYQPAVHVTTTLQFADKNIELAKIAGPSKEAFVGDRAVLRNYKLLDTVPFRGGTIEIDAALIGVKGEDHLAKAIAAVSGFADLLSGPVSMVLAVADKVKKSADLLFDEDGEIHLAHHNELGGSGGANLLAAGYVAVVGADATVTDWSQLFVRDDELWWGGGNNVGRVTNFDYMLLRVESLATRDDLAAFTDIETLRDQAIAAYSNANTEEGDRVWRQLVATVASHPDLINADRRALLVSLKAEIDEYRKALLAATPPPAAASWTDLTKSVAAVDDHAPLSLADLDAAIAY